MEFFFAGYRLVVDEAARTMYNYETQLLPFKQEQPYSHTLVLHVGSEEDISQLSDSLESLPVVCELNTYRIYRRADGWAFVTTTKYQNILLCSRDYQEMTLYSPAINHNGVMTSVLPLSSIIRCACEAAIVCRGGIPLHASLVEKNGYGILFLGASGIGKSTQATLWRDILGADFISGDRPALRCINDEWYAYGMPWDGKDVIFRQKAVPVKACISLSQAKENHITPLSRDQAMIALLNQVMLPMWDDHAMNGVFSLMTTLASDIPFYHLACLPNDEAVYMTFKTIFGE